MGIVFQEKTAPKERVAIKLVAEEPQDLATRFPEYTVTTTDVNGNVVKSYKTRQKTVYDENGKATLYRDSDIWYMEQLDKLIAKMDTTLEPYRESALSAEIEELTSEVVSVK
jgi:hypothetical protein